jgi:hypothetical protein
MNPPPHVLEGEPIADEQTRLSALFDEMEKKQVDFLDEAGKRIIELTTGLVGVVFVVMAFGDKFPPPYLKDNFLAQLLAVLILGFYILAMFFGVATIWPREYKRHHYNVTEMRNELKKIVRRKSRVFTIGSVLFGLGSLSLATLVGIIIFSA